MTLNIEQLVAKAKANTLTEKLNIEKPKYGEELKASESTFTSWQILLPVQKSELDPRAHYTCYYSKGSGNTPHEHMSAAMNRAHELWREWEGPGPNEAYPDILGYAQAQCIDDGDYAYAWKQAKKFPHKFAGHEDNPTCFTFWPT